MATSSITRNEAPVVSDPMLVEYMVAVAEGRPVEDWNTFVKKHQAYRAEYEEAKIENPDVICPKCGRIASYEHYFGEYLCRQCGNQWVSDEYDRNSQVDSLMVEELFGRCETEHECYELRRMLIDEIWRHASARELSLRNS